MLAFYGWPHLIADGGDEDDDLKEDVVIDQTRLGKLADEVEDVVLLDQCLEVELWDVEVGQCPKNLPRKQGGG